MAVHHHRIHQRRPGPTRPERGHRPSTREAVPAPLAETAGTQITATPTAVYPYRTAVTKDAFADRAHAQSASIDYPNFKSEVAHARGHEFADTLMGVWSTLQDRQDTDPRVRS